MATSIPSTTFRVSDVEIARELLDEVPYERALQDYLRVSRLESWPQAQGNLVAKTNAHPLIAALHAAFDEHRPICLSPDMIWLTLMQGLAQHVNMNAKTLQKEFVQHDEPLTIVVIRDSFRLGNATNDWPGVFSEFSRVIHDYIGKKHELIVANFSTSTPLSRAASEVTLLDAVQSFFKYEVHTRCGIPRITLEGTADDWRSMIPRLEALRSLGLEFWINAVKPHLAKFVDAVSGRVDREFWESIYKWHGPVGSGHPFVTGWILDFFPYLQNPRSRFASELVRRLPADHPMRAQFAADLAAPRLLRNPWLGFKRDQHDGPGRDDFPAAPSRAPFQWVYLGTRIPMFFYGGLVGVRQDSESLCLRPEIGWAVTPNEDG